MEACSGLIYQTKRTNELSYCIFGLIVLRKDEAYFHGLPAAMRMEIYLLTGIYLDIIPIIYNII